jgi:hypothetical protein
MKAGHSKLDGYRATLPATSDETLPSASNRRSTSSTAACLASMRSYIRPSTHRRESSNTRFAELGRVGRPQLSHRLPLVKSRMVPYHALHLYPLPRLDPLLNRLAADPPPLSPASIAPLAVTSPAPAISWLSKHLPPAYRAGETLLLDGFKLSSMAVPYLLSFGWDKNTSHRK